METTGNAAASLLENRFWLQIMGDHARFIYYLLAPIETEYIRKAQQFIFLFDQLLEQTARPMTDTETDAFNRTAYEKTYSFREFKLQMQTLVLESKLNARISPTLFNHMLNELEEYLLILSALTGGQSLRFHPLHYHMLWLSDAIQHAALAGSNLDAVEKDYIEKSRSYEMQFTELYIKAIEANGYTRTKLADFPALGRLNEQAVSLMTPFKTFLEEIRDARLGAQLLGTLMPLIADHMAREECYYLTSLSAVIPSFPKPDCDPGRKRVEG